MSGVYRFNFNPVYLSKESVDDALVLMGALRHETHKINWLSTDALVLIECHKMNILKAMRILKELQELYISFHVDLKIRVQEIRDDKIYNDWNLTISVKLPIFQNTYESNYFKMEEHYKPSVLKSTT